MNLSNEQKDQLKLWLDDGMTLTEVYKKVSDEWKLHLTYIELRFLIDDLGLNFVEPKIAVVANADLEKNAAQSQQPEEPELVNSNVAVSVDKVVRPGALASGSVTFSDGMKAAWQLDQMGRIGLIPSKDGYKPSQEDIQEFQVALQDAMHKSGF